GGRRAGTPWGGAARRRSPAPRVGPFFPPRRGPSPPPAVGGAPPPPPPPSPRRAAPERPPLSILGTVVGRSDSIGIFLEEANQNVLRLHAGQDYAGWILRAVAPREVKFEKGAITARLNLPASRQDPAAAPIADAPSGD